MLFHVTDSIFSLSLMAQANPKLQRLLTQFWSVSQLRLSAFWLLNEPVTPSRQLWCIHVERFSSSISWPFQNPYFFERAFYHAILSRQPACRDRSARIAATIKARWICEQAHQQLKEELGLDHFEGRSWQGLHRHALMTMIAYAFLQHRRLAQAGRKKKNQRTSASAKPAGLRHAIVDLILRPSSQRCPSCRRRIREKPQQINLPK
jgi:Transposase DDE domain